MRIPSVLVYIDKRNGDWRIQRYSVDAQSKFTVSTGEPVFVPSNAVASSAFDVIAKALGDFSVEQQPAASSIDKLPGSERRRFFKSQFIASISMPDQNSLEIYMMKPSGNGLVGDPGLEATVSRKEFHLKLVPQVLALAAKQAPNQRSL